MTPKKLRLDLPARSWRVGFVGRDEEIARLISDLLVRAGMLMEDLSPDCVSFLPHHSAARRRLRKIALNGIAIPALVIAAWALLETTE